MVTMRAARPRPTFPKMMAITAVLLLSLTAVTGGKSVESAESEELVPDENSHLTQSELRWCFFESERLSGEESELDDRKRWEIDSYNLRITAYNKRCSGKTYYERDEIVVEHELTVHKRRALWEDGTSRVRQARAEREGRRAYVMNEPAIMRAAPDITAKELGRVPRWGELIKTGRVQGRWYEVEWQAPSLERALTTGWVIGGLLQRGSGKEARFEYCEEHKQGRASHGTVVRQEIAPVGTGYVEVENGTRQDSYVKLVRRLDRAVLSLFVEAGKTATFAKIPNGSFEIAFATGSKFSRGCDTFSKPGGASKFAQLLDFDERTAGYALTLHTVSDGNTRVHSMSYDDFDSL